MYHIIGPHIVVMPLSVMSSWEAEFHKFAPHVHVYAHAGKQSTRLKSLTAFFESLVQTILEPEMQPHVMLTTYEILMKDLLSICRLASVGISWGYLVVGRFFT